MSLDSIDWKILSLLQGNARMPNVDLAKAVGLSPSPCLNRVRALEESGYISRYVTLLDPLKVPGPVVSNSWTCSFVSSSSITVVGGDDVLRAWFSSRRSGSRLD